MAGFDHKYLKLTDLHRLKHLLFVSRRPVEGLFSGRHASRQRGKSVEFSDYRPYLPGDEVADIDWKVYGRSDRLFVKLFEHQSDMTVHLVVDASASMAYDGVETRRRKREQTSDHSISKYDYAAKLAASIAFLVTQQSDRFSFSIVRNGLRYHQPAGRSPANLQTMLHQLGQTTPAGPARLAEALHELTGRIGRRGLLVLISDFLDEPEPILRAISQLTHRGAEAAAFQVLHEHELNLPRQVQDAIMIDSESGGRVRLNVDDVREEYERKMRQFLDTWSAALAGRAIDRQLVSTAQPYIRALQHYLLLRSTRSAS